MDIRAAAMEAVHGNKLEHITRVMRMGTSFKKYDTNMTGGYKERYYSHRFHQNLIEGLSNAYGIEHEVSWEILNYWGKNNDWTEFGNMVVI